MVPTLTLNSIRRRFEKDRFLHAVLMLTGSTALGQALQLAALPLVTRLYTPSALGQLGIFVAFLSFASVAVCLRLESAIVTPPDAASAARLTILSIAVGVPLSIVSTAVLALLISRDWLGYGTLPKLAWLIGLPTLVLTAAFFALRYWLIRERRFSTLGAVNLYQNGARALTQIVTGFFAWGPFGLLLGELTGRAAGLTWMWRVSRSSLLPHLPTSSTEDYRRTIREHKKFPLLSMPSSLIDAAAANVTLPLMAVLYGSAEAGMFALVLRTLSAPGVLIGQSVADTYHAQLASLSRDDRAQMRVLFRRTAASLLAFGLLPTAIIMFAGKSLFRLVFGDVWGDAGMIAAIMAPAALAQLVVSPLSRAVLILSGQELKLVYDIASLLLVLAVLLIAHLRHLELATAVALLSAVQVAAYALYYVLLGRLVTRHSI